MLLLAHKSEKELPFSSAVSATASDLGKKKKDKSDFKGDNPSLESLFLLPLLLFSPPSLLFFLSSFCFTFNSQKPKLLLGVPFEMRGA